MSKCYRSIHMHYRLMLRIRERCICSIYFFPVLRGAAISPPPKSSSTRSGFPWVHWYSPLPGTSLPPRNWIFQGRFDSASGGHVLSVSKHIQSLRLFKKIKMFGHKISLLIAIIDLYMYPRSTRDVQARIQGASYHTHGTANLVVWHKKNCFSCCDL